VKTCIHFGVCGGCSLQLLSPEDYRAHKRGLVVKALARAGLSGTAVADAELVPERSRRRAVFKLGKLNGAVEAGFHAAKSHSIVDMRECLVLSPALFGLTAHLRAALKPILHDGEKWECHAAETDSGLDLAFRSPRKLSPALTGSLAGAFSKANIARVIFNGEMVMEHAVPSVTLAGAKVVPPPHAFLQATREGEAALQAHVVSLTAKAKTIADLFAGLGTFTFALAARAKVHAVEQEAEGLAALASAAKSTPGLKPITIEKRDLIKEPLTPPELKGFDAVVLDPPRAGAEAQAKALAQSAVPRIAYVSCDAASFARDAAILVKAGFHPGSVHPIDQFLWSGHIELVAGFERKR
jgi:23S rRNA (uracil1939-C5)-methyltransferase